jgi:hypothetical protein
LCSFAPYISLNYLYKCMLIVARCVYTLAGSTYTKFESDRISCQQAPPDSQQAFPSLMKSKSIIVCKNSLVVKPHFFQQNNGSDSGANNNPWAKKSKKTLWRHALGFLFWTQNFDLLVTSWVSLNLSIWNMQQPPLLCCPTSCDFALPSCITPSSTITRIMPSSTITRIMPSTTISHCAVYVNCLAPS